MQKKFSYPIKIDELKQNEYTFTLEADKYELVDICSVLQVENVLQFKSTVKLKYNQREHLLKVWGRVAAELELKSVISLENFIEKYDVPFELISMLIIEIEANKNYTRSDIIAKAFNNVINQGWLHFDAIEKGMVDEN